MTVTDVARHFQLDWKTVKDIDKQYLEAHYGQPDLNGLRILAVDEISIRKGHSYLTVVLGLPDRPCCLCRPASQGQDVEPILQAVDGQAAKSN